jgi:hypothetical protein
MNGELETASRRALPVLDYPNAISNRARSPLLQAALAPQHWLTIATAALPTLCFLWECRFPGPESNESMLAMMALFLLLAWTLVRLAVLVILTAVYRVWPHSLRAHWRWITIPIMFVLCVAAARTDVVAKLVFELHRGRMEQVVTQVRAGQMPPAPLRVGLYNFTQVWHHSDGRVNLYAQVDAGNYAFVHSAIPRNGNIDQRWSFWSND